MRLARLGSGLGLFVAITLFAVGSPAAKYCEQVDKARDLVFDFDTDAAMSLEAAVARALELADFIRRYDASSVVCDEEDVAVIREASAHVLGNVHLRRFQAWGKKRDLLLGIQYLTSAQALGHNDRRQFRLGLATVFVGLSRPPSNDSFRRERDGLNNMWQALTSSFGAGSLRLVATAGSALRVDDATYPSDYIAKLKSDLTGKWSAIRADLRTASRATKSAGEKAQECAAQREHLQKWGEQLNAHIQAQGGLSRQLMIEIGKLKSQTRALSRRCGKLDKAIQTQASLGQTKKWVFEQTERLEKWEQPLRFTVWGAKLLQAIALVAARHGDGQPARAQLLVPLARMAADIYTPMLGNNICAANVPEGDQTRVLDPGVRLCGEVAKNAKALLMATFFNGDNFAAGARRMLGSTLAARWRSS